MTDIIETYTETKQPEPTELERVRANYAHKMSAEFSGDPEHTKLGQFITTVTVERLERVTAGLTDAEKTEFFEVLPHRATVFQDGRDRWSIREPELLNLKPELRFAALQELIRARCLWLASQDTSGEGVGPQYYLAVLARLNADRKELEDVKKSGMTKEDTVHKRGDFSMLANQSGWASLIQSISDVCTQDPELFVDLMIAEAARQPGSTHIERLNAAKNWGFGEKYGLPVESTDEGLPYRPGKRQEDTAIARERLKLYEGEGGAVIKSNTELRGEVAVLIRRIAELELISKKTREEAELEKGAAFERERTLRAQLKAEQNAKATVEAVAAELQTRLDEVRAILDERVGLLSKDTRVERAHALLSRPPPKK